MSSGLPTNYRGRFRVGVDIGGTFTDLMLVGATGDVVVGKVLTTTLDPSEAVGRVLEMALTRTGYEGGSVQQIVHGTTLVTNAIIERKGARTALVTSEGFRDSIAIGHEHRYELYDLMLEMPEPLVPRHLRFAVPQRTLADGSSLVELDQDYLRKLTKELSEAGVEAVAVCFLHSFRKPSEEELARDVMLSVDPSLQIAISSEVIPEIGEFERASTTVANVYVQPLVQRYLKKLRGRLSELDIGGQFLVMLSSGGLATAETASRFPIRLVESGPAAGALAAAAIGSAAGRDSLLSFDMGGTTAKLSVIDEGRPLVTQEFEVDRRYRFKRGSGLPVKVPVIEMIEIGAGGGSIAWIDSLGLLKVGPESAGADPGPACYPLSGARPTVTDADLILGYLNPTYFLGGDIDLDVRRAEMAIEQHIANPLGVSTVEAAWGIHQIVNENMANAARVQVIERGKDPRELPLVAFGGAGPVHGFGVANLIGSPEVILPFRAGVASAFGLLTAPLGFDFVRAFYSRLDTTNWHYVTRLFVEMEQQGRDLLTHSGAAREHIAHFRYADIRYEGQGHEIRVPIPAGQLSESHKEQIEAEFDDRYQQLYGRSGPPVGLEVLTWRSVSTASQPEVTGRIAARDAVDAEKGSGEIDPSAALKGQRPAYFHEFGGFETVPIYDRYGLGVGFTISGPAIIEERESTAVIGPNAHLTVDGSRNLIVDLRFGEREEGS